MSIDLVMPSNHLILCHPLILLPSVFPSIRVFSNESALHIRWSKYWSFSFNISPSSEHSGFISFRINWFDLLQSIGLSRIFSSITVWKHQFLGAQPSLWTNSHIHTWLLEKPSQSLFGSLLVKWHLCFLIHCLGFSPGFPGGSDGKASACNVGDQGSIPGSGRSPGEGNGNPLQHSCLENPMDGGAW